MALEVLKARRSIRCYDPEYVIPKEDLQKILDAALNSPSTLNAQENDIIVVTNKELIQKANDVVYSALDDKSKERFINRQKRYGVKQIIMYDCSALILLVKNERANPMVLGVDTGILAMSIMTAAESIGLSTVAMGIVVRPQVEQLFNLAPGSLCLGIGIGKAKNTDVDPKQVLRKVTFLE